MTKAAFFHNNPDLTNAGHKLNLVYAMGRREKIAEMTDLYPTVVSKETLAEHADKLQDLEVIFSTWGMPSLDAEDLEKLPNLKAVFYGAGSVQSFARPFIEKGITVCSAWAANAVPVAEFCVAQIILGFKHYNRNVDDCNDPEIRTNWAMRPVGPGMFGETVAFLGYGLISKKTVELLAPYEINKLVVSGHMADEEAARNSLEKVTLEDAFKRAYIVSNHMADRPQTKGVIRGSHFESMRENAVFINTGRGAQINEAEMCEVLAKRTDLTALLDVTFPEPPVADSPLYTLPNVYMTSHIAGSLGSEVVRMADFMIDEFERFQRGEPVQYNVTLEMLNTMA